LPLTMALEVVMLPAVPVVTLVGAVADELTVIALETAVVVVSVMVSVQAAEPGVSVAVAAVFEETLVPEMDSPEQPLPATVNVGASEDHKQ
jgi:hypothetical protein